MAASWVTSSNPILPTHPGNRTPDLQLQRPLSYRLTEPHLSLVLGPAVTKRCTHTWAGVTVNQVVGSSSIDIWQSGRETKRFRLVAFGERKCLLPANSTPSHRAWITPARSRHTYGGAFCFHGHRAHRHTAAIIVSITLQVVSANNQSWELTGVGRIHTWWGSKFPTRAR